jgi:hypothetical protein
MAGDFASGRKVFKQPANGPNTAEIEEDSGCLRFM